MHIRIAYLLFISFMILSHKLEAQLKINKPESEQSLIYIMRSRAIAGSAVSYIVYFDDENIGRLRTGEYLIENVNPGYHSIGVLNYLWEKNKVDVDRPTLDRLKIGGFTTILSKNRYADGIVFHTEKDKKYYVLLSISLTSKKLLSILSEQEGKSYLEKYEPAKTK